MGSFKRNIKVGLATGASATLGFIQGGVGGAITGMVVGNKVANAFLDNDGNQHYSKDKLVKLGKDGIRTIKFAGKHHNVLWK